MMMKKILIITYYWPPSGGSGVQRWLKFIKYLCKQNYYCIVYTPKNPENPVTDLSLMKDIPNKNLEIIKTPITEPYHLYKKFTGQSSKEKITVSFLQENQYKKSSFTQNISKWIRGNIFIPDARMLWIKPSIKYISHYLSKNKIDVIISTGPPHSMHLIAMGLKKNFPNIKWIADFRDPWASIDFLPELKLTKYAWNKHKMLEKKVLQKADAVLSVSPTLTQELLNIAPEQPSKYFTITNGYDEDDFLDIMTQKNETPSNEFTIVYAGLMPFNRNPEVLWKAIHELGIENNLPKNFKVHLIGKIDHQVWKSIAENNIEHYIQKTDYLPHNKVLKLQANANALLLIINKALNSKGILTGKIFEYFALQKPILTIGPKDGDAAKIIEETQSGIVVEHDNINEMKNALKDLFSGKIKPSDKDTILRYSRRKLTEQLIQVIEK